MKCVRCQFLCYTLTQIHLCSFVRILYQPLFINMDMKHKHISKVIFINNFIIYRRFLECTALYYNFNVSVSKNFNPNKIIDATDIDSSPQPRKFMFPYMLVYFCYQFQVIGMRCINSDQCNRWPTSRKAIELKKKQQ